jgi:hypothetical protein
MEKKFQIFINVILILTLSACASIHSGDYAKEVTETGVISSAKATKSNIVVSGSEITSMSSEFFTMVDITFENKNNKWVEITNIQLSYGDKVLDDNFKVPLGEQLTIWGEAADQNKAIGDYNTGLALSAIAAIGGGVAASSRSKTTQNVGLGVFAASATTLTYRQIVRELDGLELAKVTPRSHLLHQPFFIPPGLHTKKWITLNLENPLKVPFWEDLVISYKADGKEEKIVLKVRKKESMRGSKLQNGYFQMEQNKKKQDGSWTPY